MSALNVRIKFWSVSINQSINQSVYEWINNHFIGAEQSNKINFKFSNVLKCLVYSSAQCGGGDRNWLVAGARMRRQVGETETLSTAHGKLVRQKHWTHSTRQVGETKTLSTQHTASWWDTNTEHTAHGRLVRQKHWAHSTRLVGETETLSTQHTASWWDRDTEHTAHGKLVRQKHWAHSTRQVGERETLSTAHGKLVRQKHWAHSTYPQRQKLWMGYQVSQCFWKTQCNAGWPFRDEPSSDHVVPKAAMHSVKQLR